MKETQETIYNWFCSVMEDKSAERQRIKLSEEINEWLLSTKTENEAEELTDIVIVINNLLSILGHNLEDLIEKKMNRNRARKWDKNNHHIEEVK